MGLKFNYHHLKKISTVFKMAMLTPKSGKVEGILVDRTLEKNVIKRIGSRRQS